MFSPMPISRRRARRCNVIWPATIDDGTSLKPCTITDLSEKGARLDVFGPVPPHARVKLLCDRFGELHGVVMWCTGTKIGLRFNLPAADIVRLFAPLVPGMSRRQPVTPAPATATKPGERHGFGRKSRAA